MSTLRDLLAASYRLINVLGQGTSMDANMITNGLYALDTMQDSMSNERLMIYSIKPYIFNTAVNQKSYTLGPESDTPGEILAISFQVTGGTGYTDGKYNNVPVSYVTSGNGTAAVVNIVVNLGAVIDVQLVDGGLNYLLTDNLTVDNSLIGGTGTGFVFRASNVVTQTDWVIKRPMKIEAAYTIWNDSLSAQAVDIPIQLLTMEQYASISVKNTPSTFSFALYDDNSYPVRIITMFPIPTSATGVRLWLREPLVDATYESLDQPINYPEGYERMFRFNLAVELAAEYGKAIPQEVLRTANESKDALARMNQAPMFKKGDSGLTPRNHGVTWNYITGNFNYWGNGW